MPVPDESGRTTLSAVAAQLDTVFDTAPIAMGLFDRDVRHVRVNALLAEMNALTADALVGRTPSELHGAVGVEAEALYRRVMESGEPMRDVPLTGEIGSRPGQTRHWSASFAPVRLDEGIVGLLVAVADVTHQHDLTVELQRSEERSRQLAEDLQRSLLPPLLPRLDGAELASAYRPASAGASVGGDFFDVLRLSASTWGLVIGDVQGKGPVAASLTAAVRYAIRTAAVVRPEPAAVLRTVNQVLLLEEHEDALCTVAYVLAERDGDRVRLRAAAAGHPLPLVVRRETAAVEALGVPGTLLGTVPDPDPDLELTEATTVLHEGDCLVLYTDGVTEARVETADGHVELLGEERLQAVLRDGTGDSAADLAARIESAVVDFQAGEPADDLAVVVLRAASAVRA